MPKVNIGWVGNYRRMSKHFDVALHVCNKYGYTLHVAGPPNTALHRPHEEMPEFYRSKDILLVTSQREAHPLAVYESLACGTPVIMKKVGDCRAEGIPGICYYKRLGQQDDIKSIHKCIRRTFKNRDVMGRAGREEIVRRWQWKHWIPKYTDMFQRVTEKKKGLKVAIIIDKPKWAWDIMAKIIQRELLKTGIYTAIDIIYTRTGALPKKTRTQSNIRYFEHENYDAILNHCWTVYNHIENPDFPHEKNIPCANGDAYFKEGRYLFKKIAEKAVAFTSVSKIIAKNLETLYDKPVYHCSRGVDVEMFKP